jgi:Nucleotidyl transferase AbiEii toxin, Type IV TA system
MSLHPHRLKSNIQLCWRFPRQGYAPTQGKRGGGEVEALVKLGMANSRMKDFYDLWVMAAMFEFHGPVLGEALSATFARRKTMLPASIPLAFKPEFSTSPSKQTQWRLSWGRVGWKRMRLCKTWSRRSMNSSCRWWTLS